MSSFVPLQAAIGGVFIGVACGAYMLLQSRVAGNSGAVKAVVNGPREPTKLGFVCGLVAGGAAIARLIPHLFEATPAPSLPLAAAGLCVGVGTAWANGCTSGHGLCGLSRFSLRSLAAVPTFMAAAMATATLTTTATFGGLAPIAPLPHDVSGISLKLAAALAVALPPYFLLTPAVKPAYAGLWVGSCFAFGLSIGGMVRPSVIIGALSPGKVDFTLWVLFMTALAVTFALYRVAARAFSIKESSLYGTAQPMADAKLVAGSVLFGIGWGTAGSCPGPLVVVVGAAPLAPGTLLYTAALALGMRVAAPLWRLMAAPPATQRVSSAAKVASALARADAVVVDLRVLEVSEATGATASFDAIVGAVSAPWDKAKASMPLGALPADKTAPLVLYCRSGNRATAAARFLFEKGFTNLTNAGGPAGPAEQWALLCTSRGVHSHDLKKGLLQLFDGPAPKGGGSSTFTYLLWDAPTKEALLIDPVLEQVDRDLAEAARLGVNLVGAINTHCHADHITSTGVLKKRLGGGFRSHISKASGAAADVKLSPGEAFTWAGGTRCLKVLATPGHTNGCISLHDAELGAVFTGDALLIGGCGRTDFQEGSAAQLYDSVHQQLFTLPASTMVLPAHDYKGRCFSTVAAERAGNPRLTKSRHEFVELMANLNLPYPKKIDASLPANLKCGL